MATISNKFLIISLLINVILADKNPILVHVIFRHGARTIDAGINYPNDPYINKTYYPYGFGQLTNEGKLGEYKLGQYLRERYNLFLGDLYTPEILDARSTFMNRTKMSMELVLAGLFPPNDLQTWLPGLNWQPIPYNYWPLNQDEVLFGWTCQNYLKYLNQYMETSQDYKRKFEDNREIFEFIEQYAGYKNASFFQANFLYATLLAEDEWGLLLPEWTKCIYPEVLKRLTLESYRIQTATITLRKLTSGYLLKKIIEDTQAKLTGTLIPQNRKIFLYSAHELTLAYLMLTLGIDVVEIPPYSSSIMVEIHQINKTIGIKIFYENSLNEEPIPLELPNCGLFCPLDSFVEEYQKYFANISLCRD